ncbi:MAG TPA: tetratricopeptide repeat protein [Terriglobales bacterium]|nr:tetratricopeptide repeat protein [Terriglobales bacterium]
MGRRLLLFFLLLFSVASQAGDRGWVQVQSQHFTVLTDTSEKQGREVALRFEQMRTVFGSLFHKTKVNIPVPLTIIAFRNQGEFKNYGPIWKGKPVQAAGFFQGSEDRNYIALDMSSNDPYSVVYHEYAHLLLHGNFPVMPIWFDEGFAEYFSTLKVTDKTVEFGTPPQSAPYILQQQRWMPIVALFSVQHNSAEYNERDKNTILYAQSWLVVHYLMTNQKVMEAAKYLQMTQIEKKPVDEAIRVAFGVEPAAFEKQLRDYFYGQGKYFRLPMPEMEEAKYVTTKLDDLTAQASLADLHAHSIDHQDQAVKEFEDILQRDAGNVVANRGLGYYYLHRGEFDKAQELFRHAALKDSKDPQLHYLTALLMNREAMKTGGTPENVELMINELQQAIELDPTLADAYNLLAFAQGSQRKFQEAIDSQKKAIELNPSLEIYQSNLARIYLQAEQWDEARAILARLQQSQNPLIRENASQNLAALEANKEMAAQIARAREMRKSDPTDPRWQPKTGSEVASNGASTDDEGPKPDTRKVLYMYGQLQSVICTSDVAVLKVRSGQKVMNLRTDNYKKLLVMGADEFDCAWRDKKVLVNYKPGGKSDGDLVTLELQAGK